MDYTAIIVAIIGFLGVGLTSILSTVAQIKKLRQEQEQTITDSLNKNRDEYIKGISDVKESVSEMNVCISSIQADNMRQWQLFDLRLQHLTDEFSDLKTDVRSHNNFAQRLPILEEKISVANHRLADLERITSDDGK